jgi:hypothetical protein
MNQLFEHTRSTGADVAGQQNTRLNRSLNLANISELAKVVSESSSGTNSLISCKNSVSWRSELTSG